MATRKVIAIQGEPREERAILGEACRPGSLMEYTAGGAQKHSTAGGIAAAIFLRAQHENQGADIDDNVASGDEGTLLFPKNGDVINAVTADTIARGEWVESDGTGGVRVFGSGYRLGYARAASDLSGTVGRVEIVVASGS